MPVLDGLCMMLTDTSLPVRPPVITRRLTPANRPLQLLEAGRLGAFATEHLPSRPAVPDLCIASSSLLSALVRWTDCRDTPDLWPAADRQFESCRHSPDAVLMRRISPTARRTDDDSLTLMSAGLIPRLEGGIRAVLYETANL